MGINVPFCSSHKTASSRKAHSGKALIWRSETVQYTTIASLYCRTLTSRPRPAVNTLAVDLGVCSFIQTDLFQQDCKKKQKNSTYQGCSGPAAQGQGAREKSDHGKRVDNQKKGKEEKGERMVMWFFKAPGELSVFTS